MSAAGSPDFQTLKANLKAAWTAGDFGQIAKYAERGEEEFVARLPITPGARVLDVACGTGNTALPAARRGAKVTGVDIAANWLEQARQRASHEGLSIAFEEGDAEELRFADGSFDLVISVFGAMFAPRPDRVAAELLRVCRSGGTIAMLNWTPEGFVGEMFKLSAKHVPPPPTPAPSMWGDEGVARQRFDKASAVRCEKRQIPMVYPFGPAEVVDFFRQNFGPTQKSFARLDEQGRNALAADLTGHFSRNNTAKDGTTAIVAEALEVVATR